MARLEHVNITVSDPNETARLLCQLFDWKVRWEGPSALGGNTVHVGDDSDYIAVYTSDDKPTGDGHTGHAKGGLNHVGIAVDDLNLVESRVLAAGFRTHNHGDYEPGRRFYFNDHDGIEFEVVSYR